MDRYIEIYKYRYTIYILYIVHIISMPAESDIAGKHVMISYIFELETHLQTAVTWKGKNMDLPKD